MPHIVIEVRVKPGSRRSALERQADNSWVATLRAPPVDGKANTELIALVAHQFGCSKSAVTIRTGASARVKRLQIETA